MTLYLDLDENPKGTSQQKGETVIRGRIHHFEKANVRNQRAVYVKAIREALKDIDREPPHYEGPVFLNVTFYYSIKAKKRWGEWKTSKPDCDNAVKLLQDVLSDEGFFATGDEQVASLRVKKVLAEQPGIHIEIGRLIQP